MNIEFNTALNGAKESHLNILNYNRCELEDWLEASGETRFRGKQLFQWVHSKCVTDFTKMSNISNSLRDRLIAFTEISLPEIVMTSESSDGVVKWLLRLKDKAYIETVYIPTDSRKTLCVSSQVGCALKCDFCATGKQGFKRNLDVSEIIGQLLIAESLIREKIGKTNKAITNVVFMGMGEPILNLRNVVSAVNIMLDDLGYSLARKRVTVSTSGIVPGIIELSKCPEKPSLAVSLHAPNDEIRSKLVPINKKYPIKILLDACKKYYEMDSLKRFITMEYIMLDQINSDVQHAKDLRKILSNVPSKINLIPFNSSNFVNNYKAPTESKMNAFAKVLIDGGYNVMIRKSRGRDIAAACGQLNAEQAKLNGKIEII